MRGLRLFVAMAQGPLPPLGAVTAALGPLGIPVEPVVLL